MTSGFMALVCYPGLGSMWLSNCHIQDGTVYGETLEDGPLAGTWVTETWNFPVSCIRKRLPSTDERGEG